MFTRTILTPCASATSADIRLNAYPGQVFKGRIDNILPILDPNIRTAKVRIEVPNPGVMRVGMFVTATFYGKQPERTAAVPATAILHLHDREWVYVPIGRGTFQASGSGQREHASRTTCRKLFPGLKPGDRGGLQRPGSCKTRWSNR